MAVTKIWCHRRQMSRQLQGDVKKSISDGIYYVTNPDKTTVEGIADSESEGVMADVFNSLTKGIEYASDSDKTTKEIAELESCFSKDDDCRYITGINCSGSEKAIDEFVLVKKQWGNLDAEITHYHGIQSFMGYECSPETAHEIGVELARRLWGDRFQVVVCTHINKDNVHNHFIVNATSFADGKRYYDNNRTYYKMRYESDMLCEIYGLSVVDTVKSRKGTGRGYYYNSLDNKGAPTRLNIAKEAIDEAVSRASSLEELKEVLHQMEFECDFSLNHKHWTIRSFGWDKCIRLSKLEEKFGEDYSKLGIYNRLGEERKTNIIPQPDKISPKKPLLRARLPYKGNPFTKGIYGRYIRWLYMLGVLPNKKSRYTARYAVFVNYIVRDDLININHILEEARLIAKYRIETGEQLSELQSGFREELSELMQKKARLPKTASAEEKKQLNEEIRQKKREVKMCDNIWNRSLDMAEKLKNKSKKTENNYSEQIEEIFIKGGRI